MGNPGNSEPSLARRRRSGEWREKGLSRLLHKAVLTPCVCVNDGTDTGESGGG